MKRAAVLIISGGVLIAATAWLFSHASVQWKALDFWEVVTGHYIIERDTLNGTDRYVGVTSNLLDRTVALDVETKEKMKEAKQMISIRHERSWCSSEEECRIIEDPWVAEAKGYFLVRTEECPVWEDCKTVRSAYFVVTETKSAELISYHVPPGKRLPILLGCDDGSRIRFITYENIKSWPREYDFFSGDGLESLRGSSKAHPVTIRFDKPARPYGDPQMEGVTCEIPFSKYEVIE